MEEEGEGSAIKEGKGREKGMFEDFPLLFPPW